LRRKKKNKTENGMIEDMTKWKKFKSGEKIRTCDVPEGISNQINFGQDSAGNKYILNDKTEWVRVEDAISRVTSSGKIIYKKDFAYMMDFPYPPEKDCKLK